MDSTYKSKMTTYVNEQIPKLKTVTNDDLESMFENFSPDQIVETSGLTAEEVVDSFRLSLITESLTEQYSETYKLGAKMFDAQWLNDYVVGFWEPDENGHADPFKNILLDFGLDQKVIADQIDEAKHTTDYKIHHEAGFSPIALTTYGMIQECITDYWYELQRNFFPKSSNTNKVISKVKGREALHTVQFRDLTAFQLEADPSLLPEIIHSTINFSMPSNHIPVVQEIEAKTQEWLPKMDGDVTELLRRIIFHINGSLNDKTRLGQLLTEYASASENRFLALVPNHVLSSAISHLKGGYGLVGEIILEQLGLSASEPDMPKDFNESLQFKIKSILKRWAIRRMDLEGLLQSGNPMVSPQQND